MEQLFTYFGIWGNKVFSWNDIIGIFLLIAGFIIGLGAVTVIDLHGFLGRTSSYWTEATIRTHKITKPLIWIGIFLAIIGGFIAYRDIGFSGTALIHSLVAIVLILNGCFLSFWVSPQLLKREKEGKAREILPSSLQIKIAVSFVISVIGWWGSLFINEYRDARSWSERCNSGGSMSLLIDAHLHVWDGSAAGKDPGPFPVGYSPQSQAPVELLLDYMDEAGVERAVFVQPWFHHWDNSYIASCLQRFPDRFRGVCVIDPRGPAAPAALRQWRARGFTGIRLRPLREGEDPRPGPWLATEETIPLWETIAETDTIACVMHGKTELSRLHCSSGDFLPCWS